jgi:hypothetical protein
LRDDIAASICLALGNIEYGVIFCCIISSHALLVEQ